MRKRIFISRELLFERSREKANVRGKVGGITDERNCKGRGGKVGKVGIYGQQGQTMEV